jgi:hypothetical protein
MQISPQMRQRIVDAVESSVETVLQELHRNGITDRTGGCFALGFSYGHEWDSDFKKSDFHEGKIPQALGFSVGEIHLGKFDRYSWLAPRKNQQLIDQHYWSSEVSSWQSRDPDKNLFGGSIYTDLTNEQVSDFLSEGETYFYFGAYLGFSGFTEEADEAVVLLTARKLGWKTDEPTILATSKNAFAMRILNL